MKDLAKWLERLSLDAVLVAVVWGLALGRVVHRTDLLWDIIILGLATWLTYVSDRLWDVRQMKVVPDTDRHLYYRNHYAVLRNIWLVGFASSILLAVLFLPGWKVLWGWILVVVIVLYLWAISKMQNGKGRTLLKKSVVPLVFTAGVVLMVESWISWEGLAGSALLLSAALSNVLLISYWKNHQKKKFVWMEGYTKGSLVLMLISAHIALFLYWPLGVAGLLCAGGYFFLFVRMKTSKVNYLGAWADGLLMASGCVVILMV